MSVIYYYSKSHNIPDTENEINPQIELINKSFDIKLPLDTKIVKLKLIKEIHGTYILETEITIPFKYERLLFKKYDDVKSTKLKELPVLKEWNITKKDFIYGMKIYEDISINTNKGLLSTQKNKLIVLKHPEDEVLEIFFRVDKLTLNDIRNVTEIM